MIGNMDQHLTRSELLQAANNQQFSTTHLEGCAECRELVELLRVYCVSGKLHLPDAPAGWIEKAIAITGARSLAGRARTLIAELVFDSWSVPHAVGVRGGNVAADRRLRFESQEMVFDMRSEQHGKSWEFVARVHPVTENLQLEADKKKLTPDDSGVFQWSSARPPRKITLRSDDRVVALPELSWKKPQLK